MSNVLICFLGTGKYEPIHYALNGRTTERPEIYVQSALVQLLETPEMNVRILVTAEARKANLPRLLERFQEIGVEGSRLSVIDIEISAGEAAPWTMFERILENVNDGERVWFDITHGFRALPVIALLALTFARNVKKFTFEGLFYGAFEARDETTAPIFDLTAMMALPSWSEALAEWTRTGRADGIVEQTRPYLDQVQRQRQQASALTRIPDALQQVSDALMMVRHDQPGLLATVAVDRIVEAQAELPSHPSMKPLRLILEPLKQDMEELSGVPKYDPNTAQAKAVVIDAAYLRRMVRTGKWFLKRNRVAEGSTTLRETITACAVRLVRHGGVDEIRENERSYPWHHEKYRMRVDWGLQVLSGAERESASFVKETPLDEAIAGILEGNPELKATARKALSTVRAARNKINHAWTSGDQTKETFNSASAREFVKSLDQAARDVNDLVEMTIAVTEDPRA